MKNSAIFLLAILVFVAFTLSECAKAQAASGCGNFDLFAQSLAKNYNEAPTGIGIAADATVIYVFFTSPSGTWTVIAKAPDGHACILAAGRNWQNIKLKPPETKL